jgi:hypothetical protein
VLQQPKGCNECERGEDGILHSRYRFRGGRIP